MRTNEKLGDSREPSELVGSDWCELLMKQPELADKCDWERLNCFDWSLLLKVQPQFANRCPWEIFDGRAPRQFPCLGAVAPEQGKILTPCTSLTSSGSPCP